MRGKVTSTSPTRNNVKGARYVGPKMLEFLAAETLGIAKAVQRTEQELT